MTTQSTASAANANQIIIQLQTFMGRCEELLDEGKEVNLAGMDEQVATLCEAIAQMPFEQADRLRPKLDSLMQEFDTLSQKLQQQKDLLSGELSRLNQQKQAHSAYQRAGNPASAHHSRQMEHRPTENE